MAAPMEQAFLRLHIRYLDDSYMPRNVHRGVTVGGSVTALAKAQATAFHEIPRGLSSSLGSIGPVTRRSTGARPVGSRPRASGTT